MPSEKIMTEQLEELKTMLLSLKPAGTDGFEGLVRVVLTQLTGVPFRLAASGLQGGLDGDSALRSDPVCFEAKRYAQPIPREQVLTKITDLALNNDSPDRLWVLGATTEVNAQLALSVRKSGDKNAISTLILDWTPSPLPLLAIATVAGGDPAIEFLTTHCRANSEHEKITQIFDKIAKHEDYERLLSKLQSELTTPSLAMGRSIEANKTWRNVSFGSEQVSRDRLGQAIAVNAPAELPPLRESLRAKVKDHLQCGESIILSGEEGHGKSWLAAQICCDHKGIALFASAEQLEGVVPQALDEYLINLLIQQTHDVTGDIIRKRWRHRYAAWCNQPPKSPVLLVVDGINQRQGLKWDHILNGLEDRLTSIGGSLVVTVRPQYWTSIVSPGLTFKSKLINVPEWSPNERDQLLAHYGIHLDWLDASTLQTLRNPRLLWVAATTLPTDNASVWKGLTTDRILMEHLRASQRERFEPELFKDLTQRLSAHAKKVLDQAISSSHNLPQHFEADSKAVIETRFFKTLPGPGDTYELRSEGITLALGYTLIDQLWKLHHSGENLSEHMSRLIDPIRAMDRTVDVFFASMMVCALDPSRFDRSIFSTLLNAFSNLQNVNDKRFEEFVEIIKNKPSEFFNILGEIMLEVGHRLNQDWFSHAGFAIAVTEEHWPVAESFIHSWLRCYNKDPVIQTRRYQSDNEEEYTKRLNETKEKIHDVLSSLSPFEQQLLDSMTEVSGEVDGLYNLALQLLAGRPLAGFANSFIALGLGFSLDLGVHTARDAFRHLTMFNRIDREAMNAAFLKAVAPLNASNSSISGQWTIVRMLFATGIETASAQAEAIAEKLREDWFQWTPPSPDAWRQSAVADPNAQRPTDMDNGLEDFIAIDQDNILKSLGPTPEQFRFWEFLPVACRFAPKSAQEKSRSVLSGLLTRTNIPLRQLILNGEELTPLMTRDLATQLIKRVSNDDMLSTLSEREHCILCMFLFNHTALELKPSEQLDYIVSTSFGSDYLFDTIPKFKHQPTQVIVDALSDALNKDNEKIAYGVLVAALYGSTPITPELESLILRCRDSHSEKLRAIVFELAIENDLKTVRLAHSLGSWSGLHKDIGTYESWHGTLLLAEAGTNHELNIDEIFRRTAPETWFAAAICVGKKLLDPLADLFVQRLKGAIAATANLTPPAVDFTLSNSQSSPYPHRSVNETDRQETRFPREPSIEGFLIDKENFYEKQDRLHEISEAFYESLSDSGARLLVERITIEDLQSLSNVSPSIVTELLKIIEKATSIELPWLKNLVLAVSNLASSDYPQQAVALIQRASQSQGFLTIALGDNLTLEHQAIWSSSPSQEMQAFWRQRLLNSDNDETLAREVLAAERFGAATYISTLINELVNTATALDIAYAITIAGFSIRPEQFTNIIERHVGDQSFIGTTAKRAKSTYNTAQWASHWVNKMREADSQEEFWGYLIIAKTCMDARIPDSALDDTKWAHFAPLFRNVRKASIKDQNKTRAKNLIGHDAPKEIFITSYKKEKTH